MPHDAHLSDLVAGPTCQHKQLHIEGEAPNRQAPKQILSGLGAHELESALRVPNAGEHKYANVRVEDTSDQIPKPMLALPPRASGFPRADDDVRRPRTIGGLKKPIEIVQRHRQISIGHEAPQSARLQHPTPHSSPLASPRAPDHTDPRVRGCVLFRRPSGAVGTPIINHDDLPREASSVQVGLEFAKTTFDGVLFVERWNDDRQIWNGGRRRGGV